MERPHFVRDEIDIEFLAAGKRSETYKAHDKVIKIIKSVNDYDEAVRFTRMLTTQYHLLQEYMNPYVLGTSFIIGMTNQRPAAVAIVQPYVEGISFERAILEGPQQGRNLDRIIDFLNKAIDMQKRTGIIPDIFGKHDEHGRRTLARWYNPLYTRNAIAQPTTEGYEPVLIDTNFTRYADLKFVHLTHYNFLAHGVKRLINRIGKKID